MNDLEVRLVAALRKYFADPENMQLRQAVARPMVEYRQRFRHEGLPDWGGHSQDYKLAIQQLYRAAGIPSEKKEKERLLSGIRYHLGNYVRTVAPPEDLAALGMDSEGPRGRAKRDRRQPKVVEGPFCGWCGEIEDGNHPLCEVALAQADLDRLPPGPHLTLR